jgi:putative hydrolase of the HAD superfamily
MGYEAVLLDAGGVLMLPAHEAILEALAPLGLDVLAERLDAAHYAGMRAYDAEGVRGRVWRAYLEAYVRILAIEVDAREPAIEALQRAFASGWLWMRPIEASRVALRELVERGLRVGVVSNAEGTVERRLHQLGICQVGPGPGTPVEVIVDSHWVGVEKPDPAIFAPALRAMALDPVRCLYVGDSVRNDVMGARAAGLAPVLLDPDGRPDAAEHTRVRSLAEVVALLGL